MSSIVTAVFKATIGLLVNKGRDKAAERLKEGDVTEQIIRSVIVREIDDIKSKLNGLSRKDLFASISFFEEGIELLYEVFNKARSRSQGGQVPVQAACAEAFALAQEMRNVELTGLDESATRALANAKERFKDARIEATRAFKNKALITGDCILAMEYRVMATILETIDNPVDAIAPCSVCIKEIKSLPAVQNSFNVELRKGLMARLNRGERRKIISCVCHVNRVIFDVARAVSKPFWVRKWPTVDTEDENIDPLRDERMLEVLRKQNMEHCFVAPWSFGQEGEEKQRLERPYNMAMNSKGEFIVTDSSCHPRVKLFDRRGQFRDYLSFPVHHTFPFWSSVIDVAVDMNDNFYVLVIVGVVDHGPSNLQVYVFNNNGEVHHHFSVEGDEYSCVFRPAMIVNSKRKVVIACSRSFEPKCYLVDVYENEGQFVRSFGERLFLTSVVQLALASDDSVIVLDSKSYVHMFSEHGDHLSKFKLSSFPPSFLPCSCSIAFHHSSQHVVVAKVEVDYVYFHIYTKYGELVHSMQTHVRGIGSSGRRMIMTAEGDVALLCEKPGKVFIVC